MAISDAERQILEDIPLDDAWALVETFSTMHRWDPEDVNRGADVIIERARTLGLPVEVHEAEIFLSVPHEASVTIGDQEFRAKPPSLSLPVPEGRTAKALYIKANAENLRTYSRDARDVFGESFTGWTDFKERVAGKILITEGFGNPALTSLVEDMGAAGLIVINPGANIHWGTSSMVWGSPGLDDLARKPKIPVVAVNKPDGAAIRASAEAGDDVTLKTRLVEGWFRQKIPVVHIAAEGPGAEIEGERFVLAHGHYDSWDVGVGDNATGNAALLGIAAGLWKNRSKLRRSVRIAWWPGHSTGRYSGSTWYADNFALDLDRNCVATVNCDSPGCRWATVYNKLTCMTEMHEFITETLKDATGKSPVFIRPKRAGDASFFNIGISSYFSLSSTMPKELLEEKGYYEVSGCGGNIAWHTEDDTMEIADRTNLKTDIDLYALALLRHATKPVLPADWRATLDEYRSTLAGYKEAAGDLIDWSDADRATDALGAALTAFYRAIAERTIADEAANTVLIRLARLLVPLNYTRTLRFAQDPAVVCPMLPGMAIAQGMDLLSDDAKHAAVDVRRGVNRYAACLGEAVELVEGALS